MIFFLYRLTEMSDLNFYLFPRTEQFPLKNKQWTIKNCLKVTRSFWLRLMHHKSGWVFRSLAKKKGKQI